METGKIDFYNSKQKYESYLKTMPKWKNYAKNKKQIDRLIAWFDGKDLSYGRRVKYLYFTKYMCEWTAKAMCDIDRDGVIQLVGRINKSHLGSRTKADFKAAVKKYFDVVAYDTHPELVGWLYSRQNDIFRNGNGEDVRREKTKLSKEEIGKLLDVADIRMKCYVMVCFEGCLRPSEACACTLSDLEPTKEGGYILSLPQSKTKVRKLLLYESSQFIHDWLRIHPNKESDAFLFCTYAPNNTGKQWSPAGTRKQLKLLAKKAGIKKNIHNYTLRSSGFVYKNNIKRISPSTMEKVMGWKPGAYSRRCKDYDISTEQDAHEELMEVYGKSNKTKPRDQEMRKCRCGEVNAFNEDFCRKCHFPISPEMVARMEQKEMILQEVWKRISEKFIDYDKLGKDKEALDLLKSI